MTYDNTTDDAINKRIEQIHNELATEHGRDNVFVCASDSDDPQIVTLVGEDIGAFLFENATDVTITATAVPDNQSPSSSD